MSKKRKKSPQPNGAAATPAAETTAASSAQAATAAPAAARPERVPTRRLMDALESDTTLPQLVGIFAAMLAFPAIVSLVVKFAILPLIGKG